MRIDAGGAVVRAPFGAEPTFRSRNARRSAESLCTLSRGLAISISILTLAPSCECDDSCSDVLGILFEKSSDWEDGTYQLDLELDGEVVECVFMVPSKGWPIDHCDDDDRTAASQGGVSHRGTPSKVVFSIFFENATLASTTFEPKYEATKGWDRAACGSPCDEGAETVAIP
jgi:hypothetical protein